MTYAPSEDSDQPEHPPSQIRVFAVRMNIPWALSYLLSTQLRPSSDWALGGSAQYELGLRWVLRTLCLFCHAAAYIYIESPITWSNSWFGAVGADDDAMSLSIPGCV